MSVREARHKAEQRTYGVRQRIARVSHALDAALARKAKRPCTVCGADAAMTQPYSVIPRTFIATCLVLNDMDDCLASLPLRCVWLCARHSTHFSSLFVDAGDSSLDLERLERRAQALRAVTYGQLVVFGEAKARKVVEEFHDDVANVKAKVTSSCR